MLRGSQHRALVTYIAKCALPAGHTLVKQDQYGNSYSFPGALGLAPGWEYGATTQDDRYRVSSCLMAHINTTGQHIPLYLDGPSPLGWGRDLAYPVQEGSFIGDLFSSPPIAKFCGGRGYGSNVVAGRIGAGQTGAPYTALVNAGGSTRCDDMCAVDPSGDGYTSCAGVAGFPITVWRQFTSAPDISFESSTFGFTTAGSSQPTALTWATDEHIQGTRSLLLTVNATGAGNAYVQLPDASAYVKPGKNMTIFVKVPSGTNWDYVQPFAQDGAAKNWRWNAGGYYSRQVLPDEWNSVVVAVPADFAVSGSKVGVQIHMTGPGATNLYVDGIFFDS